MRKTITIKIINYNKNIMTSPYSGPETMSLCEPVKPEKKEESIPKESQYIINNFRDVVNKPDDIENLWNFTTKYLTYIESRSEPIISIISPQSQDSLMKTIKKVRVDGVPWSIYNCFLTISNIGSEIAQKENISESDDFYIKYVMLSFMGDSPVYQFTQLLQTLQTQDEKTKELYVNLDKRFMDSFKKYEPKQEPKQELKKKVSFLDKTYCIGGKQVSCKILIIIFIILILLLGIIGSAYWYKKTGTIAIVEKVPSGASSDASSIYSNSSS